MKSISNRVATTMFLSVAVLASIGYLMFFQTRKHEREEAEQRQQVETRFVAKEFDLQLEKLNKISSAIVSLQASTENPEVYAGLKSSYDEAVSQSIPVMGLGWIQDGEKNQWIDFPMNSIAGVLSPDSLNQNSDSIKAASDHEATFIFKSAGTTAAIRMNFDFLKGLCEGRSFGFFSKSGAPLFFCDQAFKKRLEYADASIHTVTLATPSVGWMNLGDLAGQTSWAYEDVGNYGRLVSAIGEADMDQEANLLAVKSAILIALLLGMVVIAAVFLSRSLAVPVRKLTEVTQQFISGKSEQELPKKLSFEGEIGFLTKSTLELMKKVQEMIRREVERAKLQEQLAMAGAVQKMLLPEPLIRFGNFAVHSFYRTADECGGDWWSYVVGQKKVAIFIGDVTGHGYASALLVATARGYISMLQDGVEKDGKINQTPSEMLRVLNRVTYEATRTQLNMTAMCLVFDLETGHYHLASAGHNPAYQLIGNQKVVSVNASGPRLGEKIKIENDLTEIEGTLSLGDRLVLYTDGIQEIGTEDAPLGRKGFKKFLMANLALSPDQLVNAVIKEVMPTQEGPLLDDVTFLVLERKNA